MGSTGKEGPVAMNYFAQQQTDFKPPLIANENAFLGDVATSQDADPKAPISCGFYRLEKGKHSFPTHTLLCLKDVKLMGLSRSGTPLVYEYTYHEMKIILEGHFHISDETGQSVKATKGDVFYFPKGSKITFTTDDYGLAFYTGQRKEGAA